MKEKLLAIKYMLRQLEAINYEMGYGDALRVTSKHRSEEREDIRSNSVALLDSIISMLDSHDLVDKIADAMFNVGMDVMSSGLDSNGHRYDTRCVYKAQAQAAIESIRDKDNG